MTSQTPAAIDRLVAVFRAALPGAQVADGPLVRPARTAWAVVGGDGPVGEEEDAARAVQSWTGIGARRRDETIDVVCAVGTATGDPETGMTARRAAAYRMLGAVETALRADPGLGGLTTGGAAAVTETALKYVTSPRGIAAAIIFTINIPVRS